MLYKLNLGVWGSIFAVPSCVADRLKLINGDHLKVLLYVLKNSDKLLTEEEISMATGVGTGTVGDALIFWKNMEIIEESGGELIPKKGEPSSATAEEKPPVSQPDRRKEAEIRVKLTAEPHYPPKEITENINKKQAFEHLCEIFQSHKGSAPSHTELNTLMILTEEVGLPAEVVIMLVEYSFSVDKATPAYMKKVAKDWYDSGIDSIAKAEERIQLLSSRNTLEGKLRTKFRMTSAFSSKQKEIIAGWAELSVSDELIDEAYEITLDKTGKLSFPYMDSIIRKWSEKGYKSLSDINGDKLFSKPQQTGEGTSFDIASLENSTYERYRKKQ